MRFVGKEGWISTGDAGLVDVEPAALAALLPEAVKRVKGTDAAANSWILGRPLGIATALDAAAAPLFDGRTFAGWEGDTTTVWRIDDGMIVAGALDRRQEKNDFLCTTKRGATRSTRSRRPTCWSRCRGRTSGTTTASG